MRTTQPTAETIKNLAEPASNKASIPGAETQIPASTDALAENLPKGTIAGGVSEIGALHDMVRDNQVPAGEKRAVRFAAVSDQEAEQIKAATGLDVAGYKHTIDSFAIRHTYQKHGNAKLEALRGQLPVTREDILRIPEIVASPDEITSLGKDALKNELIRYRKAFNGTTYYVEEVRNKRGELAAKTLWKTRTREPVLDNQLSPSVLTSKTLGGNQPQGNKSIASVMPGAESGVVQDATEIVPVSRAEKRQKATAALESMTNKQLREISRSHKRTYMRDAAADLLQIRDAENRAKRSEIAKKVIAKTKQIDPDRDSMAQAIAKLGGISRESATGRLRLTPEELGARGQGLMRVFTQTGKTMDEMGAALAELGYVQRDENGKHDTRDFEDKLAEVAGGLDVFTPQGMMIKAQEEYEAAQREVGAASPEEYDAIEAYADEFSDAETDYASELLDVVPFDEGRIPTNDLSDEEVDALFGLQSKAADGRETEESSEGTSRESAEGTRAQEESRAAENIRIAEQKRDEYTKDMFGAALPETTGENPRGEGKRTAEATGDMDSADAVPSGSRFASRTKVIAENTRTLGASTVNTIEEAAQAMAYLSRGAVERMDALVTDGKGNPLAVVGAFKGALSQASVYPATIAGEAFRIKGAANIWFAHNHPSGSPDLSAADRLLYNKLKDVFQGSQIAPRGLFAIAGGVDSMRAWQFTDADSDKDGVTAAPTSTSNVPVLERQYSETGTMAGPISSPAAAKSVAAEIANGESGILLLDVKNRPVGFVPVDVAAPLRQQGRMDALYRALSVANPAGAMVIDNGSLTDAGVRNLAGFLNSIDTRVLDVFDTSLNPMKSWAEHGESFGGQTFFSRRANDDAQFLQQAGRGCCQMLSSSRTMESSPTRSGMTCCRPGNCLG